MAETAKEQRLQLSGRVRHRAVAGEGVLVHLDSGRVLVVSEVGLFIVQQLGEGAMTVADLADAVVREFEVEPERARADVAVFLDELRAEQVLECSGSTGAAPKNG